jgi:hypothetical protein
MMYYKDIINHILEDQNYLYSIVSLKKKINIAKTRKLHSESRHWTNTIMSLDERICHLCETKRV